MCWDCWTLTFFFNSRFLKWHIHWMSSNANGGPFPPRLQPTSTPKLCTSLIFVDGAETKELLVGAAVLGMNHHNIRMPWIVMEWIPRHSQGWTQRHPMDNARSYYSVGTSSTCDKPRTARLKEGHREQEHVPEIREWDRDYSSSAFVRRASITLPCRWLNQSQVRGVSCTVESHVPHVYVIASKKNEWPANCDWGSTVPTHI